MAKKIKMTADQATALLAARGLDTKAAALEARVECDVRQWGESERDASRKMHAQRSHALLVNSIAVHDVGAIDEELQAAAAALFSEADKAELRRGG